MDSKYEKPEVSYNLIPAPVNVMDDDDENLIIIGYNEHFSNK